MDVELQVNNAGILLKPWDEPTFDIAKKTNFDGPVHLTQKIAPYLAPGWLRLLASKFNQHLVTWMTETIEQVIGS